MSLRHDLIIWISDYLVERDARPRYGNGSNTSDLLCKLHKRLIRKYKVTKREKSYRKAQEKP